MANSFGRARSYRGSLIVMLSVLTLFFVYLANTTSVLRITLYFISSIFVLGIMMEKNFFAAVISFIAVAFVGFIIVPDKSGMFPYLFFFGHYGIAKYFIDEGTAGIPNKIIKLVYFNAGFAAQYFFGGDFLTATIPFDIPIYAMIAAGEVIFLVYDWIFTKIANIYFARWRVKLMGGSRL